MAALPPSKAIKQAMDEVAPEDRWMHAYRYSGHPTYCAVPRDLAFDVKIGDRVPLACRGVMPSGMLRHPVLLSPDQR